MRSSRRTPSAVARPSCARMSSAVRPRCTRAARSSRPANALAAAGLGSRSWDAERIITVMSTRQSSPGRGQLIRDPSAGLDDVGPPRLRLVALQPAHLALLTYLSFDRSADSVLEPGATKRWRTAEARRTWAVDALRELTGIESRSLALSLEGSLAKSWTRQHGWLEVSNRILFGGPRQRVSISTSIALSADELRHTPGTRNRARQRFERDLQAALETIAQWEGDARGRKALFSEEWWRDARWAYLACRGQLAGVTGATATAPDHGYVLRRARKFLRDARLSRPAPFSATRAASRGGVVAITARIRRS